MTGLPTWAELTGLLTLVGAAIGGFLAREQRLTDLTNKNATLTGNIEALKTEAAKALRAHEEAMDMKNEELRLVRENCQRREDRLESTIEVRDKRIQDLEDKLYMGRGQS